MCHISSENLRQTELTVLMVDPLLSQGDGSHVLNMNSNRNHLLASAAFLGILCLCPGKALGVVDD